MKKIIYLFLICYGSLLAQNLDQRINTIKNELTILSTEVPGLNENVKTELNVQNITLSNLLLAVSDIHKVNINISPELNGITIANNFSDVTVSDLLVFLCKEHSLTIDFTGNILSIRKFEQPAKIIEKPPIVVAFDPETDQISIDLQKHALYEVFKAIIDASGKRLVFSPGLENNQLTAYIQNTPFEAAMNKLAYANNLFVETTKDGFYVFEGPLESSNIDTANSNGVQLNNTTSRKRRNSKLDYEVIDFKSQLLNVNFINSSIEDVIQDIGDELNIDVFTATPLEAAGSINLKAKNIHFDELLETIFESKTMQRVNHNSSSNIPQQNQGQQQSTPTEKFTFKKEGSIYYFGLENQLSLRSVEVVHLQHRSVELLPDPSGNSNSRRAGRSVNQNFTNYPSTGNQFDSFGNNNGIGRTREPINSSSGYMQPKNQLEALVAIMPDEVKEGLDIKVDYELNSFYVNGPTTNITRFKDFIKKIDKPVPVILIEVMLIEVNNTSAVETGVSWGIGEEPTSTQGDIFPETSLTIGAKTINKVIGGFDGFGSFNLGKVVPNFFATIKAMESNGKLKVRSTPKLSTLNGHRATFSNGQTSYYAVTQRNIYGTDNPQTSEITNYQPIDAELGLTIKPLVSGDGQVTLDIFVVQSSFGSRIAEDAPPDISSREFSSIIRVKDQDIVVLGGLEEQMTNNSGSGVPLLARIPIIKWLFSTRKREAKKAKLTVLIKPTIIY